VDVLYTFDDNMHKITVEDTGAGIDDAEITKVFDKYHKGDNRENGHGLGLSISKQIMQAHNGDIYAVSEGRGTQVTFTLPQEDKE
jgi:signal transduction histidine kinase